jgi:hypothetical protein
LTHAGSLFCMHLPSVRLLGPFEESDVFLDLVNTREGVVELQTSYPSQIQPPLYRVWFRRADPLGGLNPARGISFSPSLFYLVSTLRSVWPTREGLHGHPVSRLAIGECEVRLWTWDRANDLWTGHLTCDSQGACLAHPSLYVWSWSEFWFSPGARQLW